MNDNYNIKPNHSRKNMSNEFRFLGQTIPNLAIISGSFLILWGLISFFASDSGSITAFIPSFFGAPLLILGYLSNRDESKKHHYMHASMVLHYSLYLEVYESSNLKMRVTLLWHLT